MIKMLIAAAGLSLGLMMTPVATTPAQAGISIDLNVGGRISCSRGRRIVENRGFRNVRARDCRGRHFEYFARRRGDDFIVTVDSRNGRIVDVRRRRWW
jgi:hypothetical protein